MTASLLRVTRHPLAGEAHTPVRGFKQRQLGRKPEIQLDCRADRAAPSVRAASP